jgi:type I restriction enzyme S subunit
MEMSAMSDGYPLPEGWRWARLGEVSRISGGGTPLRHQAEYYGGDIPWLTPTEVPDTPIIPYITTTREYITQRGLANRSARLVPANTVLLTSRATIGRVAIAAVPLTTNQGFANFVCGDQVEPKFLAYALRYLSAQIIGRASGTTFLEIRKSVLREMQLPLPTLPEQHLIVARLERLLAHAARAEEESRQAMDKARALRGATLADTFARIDAPKVRLGEVCDRADRRDPQKTPEASFRYVDIASVDNAAKRITEARTLLGKDAPSRARQVIRANDVLVATTRPYLNAVALVPAELDGEICSTGFCVLRPRHVVAGYLFAFVQTADFVEQLMAMVRGASYPAVTDANVFNVRFPLPPLSKQYRIVERLERLLTHAARAEEEARQAMQKARALRESALTAAFRGMV